MYSLSRVCWKKKQGGKSTIAIRTGRYHQKAGRKSIKVGGGKQPSKTIGRKFRSLVVFMVCVWGGYSAYIFMFVIVIV